MTFKKKTESLIIAAQDQALNTNSVKGDMYHTSAMDLCRMCGKRVKSVTRIVSACENFTQKGYKHRHEGAQNLYWLLCWKYGHVVMGSW